MKKTTLLTPGPTPIPERVLAALSQPILHHRTPEFEKIFGEVRGKLKKIFETENEVITLASTGTGAMEAAVSNLFSPGEKIIFINAGKFGERLGKIAKTFGLNPIEIFVERGRSVELKVIEKCIEEHKDATAILFQASETSTGAKMPVKEICELAQKYHLLSVCDAITACGVFKVPQDEWKIDVLMTGAQKALMIPPGLSFISLSQKAWKKSETSTLPKFYLNLKKEFQSQIKNQTAWTPATSLIVGLNESLNFILEDGLEKVFKRHSIMAHVTREAVKAMGLECFAKDSPSDAVTAVCVPDSIKEGKKIPKIMREKYGVVITGGQDELEGKIFRLSHFGYCGPFDIITGLSALELTLNDCGFKVPFGAGVSIALKLFSQNEEVFT